LLCFLRPVPVYNTPPVDPYQQYQQQQFNFNQSMMDTAVTQFHNSYQQPQIHHSSYGHFEPPQQYQYQQQQFQPTPSFQPPQPTFTPEDTWNISQNKASYVVSIPQRKSNRKTN
jgi:hypothetical protein